MTPTAVVRPQIGSAKIIKAAASMGILGTGAHSGPRLMAMLCSPRVTARDIAALVSTEPALYARVLRVANSPFYGQRRSVTTIERALVLLGLDAVRGIVTVVCLDRTFARASQGALVDMQALLRHSLATAAAAEWLARLGHRAPASDAFIAGLLHNLGVVVQMHVDPGGTQALIDASRIDAISDVRRLESEHAAVGHEECAAIVFEAWQLPDSLAAAARHHHDPMAAPEAHRELAALVNLGANLALACGNTFAMEPRSVARDLPAMNHLGLLEEDLDHVAAELPERIAELRGALAGV